MTLTKVDGDVILRDDDTVLDAKDVHGFLTISANRVRVTRSIGDDRVEEGS